jgi:hypothetical protein
MGAIAAGQSLELTDAWIVEEICITDVQLEDGWFALAKFSSAPEKNTLVVSIDMQALLRCVRLIDQHGDTWRVVGEWNGIKRERDGLELLLDEGGQT